MNVCTKYLGHTEFFNNGIKTFGCFVATVRNTIDDEKMYILDAPQAVEKRYFLTYPL